MKNENNLQENLKRAKAKQIHDDVAERERLQKIVAEKNAKFQVNNKSDFYNKNEGKQFGIGGGVDSIKERLKEKEKRNEELRKKYLYKYIKSDKPEQTQYYKNYVE